MEKWESNVELMGKTYKILMKKRSSPSTGEEQFDYEVYHNEELKYENQISIYSKRDTETWLRQILNCKGKRFVWTRVD